MTNPPLPPQSADRPYGDAGPAPQPAAPVIPGGEVGSGLKWAWAAFTRNLGAFLVPGIVYGLVMLGLVIATIAISVTAAVTAAQSGTPVDTDIASSPFDPLNLLMTLLTSVIGALWISGILAAGTTVLRGGRPTIGGSFIGRPATIIVSTLVTFLGQLGSGLYYLPGLIIFVLFYFSVVEAAKGASIGQALAKSPKLVFSNFGAVILTVLLSIALAFTMIIPILLVALVPILQLLLLGVHHRVTGHALHEPTA